MNEFSHYFLTLLYMVFHEAVTNRLIKSLQLSRCFGNHDYVLPNCHQMTPVNLICEIEQTCSFGIFKTCNSWDRRSLCETPMKICFHFLGT